MTEKSVDILIIGGGPSGAVAGIALQKMGYTTCILDKSSFPREKVCGGSLSQKSLDLLTGLLPGTEGTRFYKRKINRVSFYLLDELITTVETEVPFYMTDRVYFDELLIRFYRELGGEVMESEPFSPGMLSQKTVHLQDTRIGFRTMIGADGVFSQVRKLIEPSFRPDTFCLEAGLPQSILPVDPEEADIVFGYLRNGYGWNFPKEEQCTIGIGAERKDNAGFRATFTLLLENNYSVQQPIVPRGGYLFTQGYVKRPYLGNDILLTGDAAGLTDPITGEGIYYAMLSGQRAAFAIDRHFRGKQAALGKAYAHSLKDIHSMMRQALFFRRIFYIPIVTRWFLHHIRKRNGVARFYLDRTFSTSSLSYCQVIPHYIVYKINHNRHSRAQ